MEVSTLSQEFIVSQYGLRLVGGDLRAIACRFSFACWWVMLTNSQEPTQEVFQAQLVLPRCMGVVAIFFVSAIQKDAKFSYHLCVLTYSSTENYISLILCTCTCRIWSVLCVYDVQHE